MAEVADKLSGHKSCTQSTIGIFFIFLINIAGKHTVIGDGAYTNITSYLPRNLNGAKRHEKYTNEI